MHFRIAIHGVKIKVKKLPLLLLIIVAVCVTAFAQSVTVTGKKVTYKRPKPIMDFKKTFTIRYPKVKASTPALSHKIEAALSYEKVLGLNLKEELSEPQWLEEADFEVTYNKNGVLCVGLSMNGTAAYPDGTTKSIVVDTATGIRVTPAMAFTNLAGLAAMVKKEQNKEVAQAIIDIKKEQSADDRVLFRGRGWRGGSPLRASLASG